MEIWLVVDSWSWCFDVTVHLPIMCHTCRVYFHDVVYRVGDDCRRTFAKQWVWRLLCTIETLIREMKGGCWSPLNALP